MIDCPAGFLSISVKHAKTSLKMASEYLDEGDEVLFWAHMRNYVRVVNAIRSVCRERGYKPPRNLIIPSITIDINHPL